MKKFILISIVAVGLMLYASSCEFLHDLNQQDEPDIEYSPTWPLNGEYYVMYGLKDGDGSIWFDENYGYFPLFVYNTSDNVADKIWIWDNKGFWDFKVKANADPKNKSFGSNAELSNVAYDSKIKVQAGQVIIDAATTSGGNKSDSIYFEMFFDDDSSPYENTWVIAGHRRTGFLEDEH